LLRKWQPRLGLAGWKITAAYRGSVRMEGEDVEAHCTWRTPDLEARILISDPAFAAPGYDVELALIHELHHPVLETFGMSRAGEEYIEMNSRLLLELDRRAA
jgi:hypothetical protein